MTDNRFSHAGARLSRATIAVFAALVVLSTAQGRVDARHAMSFVATNLGTLGGSFSEAFAVSADGLVVGQSATVNDAAVHAFFWSDGTMIDLEALADGASSSATAISNNRVIAGFGPGATHAFVRTDGNGILDLPTLGGPTSSPTAINAKGDVVGFSDVPMDNGFHAFLWTKQDRVIHDLGTLDPLGGGTSLANAINDDDVVVGESATTSGSHHAFMWRAGVMVDLDPAGNFLTSSAQGVNDNGVVVGTGQTVSGEFHAFVWTRRAGMVDIGSNGVASFGEKISGRFVIGHLTIPDATTDTSTTHGFVWRQGGGLVDIGTLPGDTGSLLVGVNDRGVVAGNSFKGTASRAFVWSKSSGIAQLPLPPEAAGGSFHANALNGDFIVGGSSCDASLNCLATLWKPAPRSGKDRDGDD